MAEGSSVVLHPGMRQSLWVDWSVQRPVQTVNRLPAVMTNPRDRYYVADQRFMDATEQEALAQRFSLTAVGPFLAVDVQRASADASAFAIQRVEPSGLESYWISSSHALRRVVPDAYSSWELRDRFGLTPNPPPAGLPANLEQIRVAHNVAVSRGDRVGAEHWLAQLLAGCDASHSRTFADGDVLLGSRLERGASLVLDVYFRASGPDPDEPELAMRSVLEAAPRSSLVPRDDASAEVGMPFVIPASRWKAGYVYASLTEIIRRIGHERWYAAFRAARQRGSAASAEFEILRLE